jgi:hypothetical protein
MNNQSPQKCYKVKGGTPYTVFINPDSPPFITRYRTFTCLFEFQRFLELKLKTNPSENFKFWTGFKGEYGAVDYDQHKKTGMCGAYWYVDEILAFIDPN